MTDPQGVQPAANLISLDINGYYGLGYSVALGQFMRMAQGYAALTAGSTLSDANPRQFRQAMAEIGLIDLEHATDNSTVAVGRLNGYEVAFLVQADDHGEWEFTVAAKDPKTAATCLRALLALTPPRQRSTENTVDLTFWSMGPYGPVTYRRALDRLAWDGVRGNYPASIRGALDELSTLTAAPEGGNMMVLHGPPGTGKTRFLQSLAASWAEWCDIHYVMDPDEMLATASYLAQVILGEHNSDRWRLVVIEDGDEFIDVDAKARTGHSIARLLNATDGLVGQGLKIMVLVSTNVSSAKFSKAVVRTGRCGAMIEFPEFTAEEANEWRTARGLPAGDAEAGATLAELYADAR